MSDQNPEHGTSPMDEPLQDLAPPPAEAPPRRGRAKVAFTAVAGVLVVAAVGFGIVALTEGDGAASAEDAVQELFEAVDRQDAIGVAESLEPTERRILVDALEHTAKEARRVEVTDDGLDLRAVDGIDLTVKDLQLHATPLDDETYAVDITAGRISSRTQLSKMPIGPVVQEVIDRNEEAGENVGDAHDDEIELTGTRLVAVERGGGWYVSALHSIAEQIRLDGDPVAAYPAAGSAIPAVGADSPEAAVREGVAAAVDADIRRLIELTPAEEARVLHTYGPILVDQMKGEETGVTVDDLELGVADAAGGRKRVSATSMTMTVTTEWDRQVTTYDGKCSTTTWESTDPEGYGDEELESVSDWTWCDDDTAALSPFGLFSVFYAPGGVDVIVEEHDGKWFLSPTRTLLQNTVGNLESLDADAVRRIARTWGGEWWLDQPDEVWEACGVARPSLDDPRSEAEAAYEECMASLPEDYAGPWGYFGGPSISYGEEESFLLVGAECYGSVNEEPSMDAIEACLAELVATGELDPSELASFRCGRIFDEVHAGEDLSDKEFDARWDDAEARHDACMDEANAGASSPDREVTFGGEETAPNQTPTTTRPPATTATTATVRFPESTSPSGGVTATSQPAN